MKRTQHSAPAATDRRNVVDHYKGLPHQAIVADLDEHGSALHIAIDNVVRDFNMGTIVRSANAFGVRHVHIIGRRQWNKRGAMMTDTYLHVHYHQTVEDFLQAIADRPLIAVDNVAGSRPLHSVALPLERATSIAAIEQFGSTRSLNVGVAAGIAMYAWVQQHRLYPDQK